MQPAPGILCCGVSRGMRGLTVLRVLLETVCRVAKTQAVSHAPAAQYSRTSRLHPENRKARFSSHSWRDRVGGWWCYSIPDMSW